MVAFLARIQFIARIYLEGYVPSIHEDLLIESGSLMARVARMQPIHHDRSKTYEGYMPSFLFINEKC